MRFYKNQLFASDISMSVEGVPEELRNPNILQMKRLAPRATVIPAQKKGVYYRNKEESDRLLSLNGDYRFALFSDTAPEGFEKTDFDDSDWDILDVPSMWQFRGYGEPTYPNVEYPFPFEPPYILRLNPVGCYRRKFTVSGKKNMRATLHFEGVDNAFYVYINGEFAGFSKGSRLPSEFDITQMLNDGENLIAVKVYTYSDASYLENQDMLLASGIFRDVYIVFSPKCAVFDWEIRTNAEKLYVSATLFEKSENATAVFELNGKKVEIPFENGKCEHVFMRENMLLWNAEQPTLYDFSLSVYSGDTLCEVHSKRVGFVESHIADRHFCINGKPVLLKGINRHENDPDNGRYITVEQTYNDLLLIKSHNINAIRCSHYPDNPAFYEYASELGIYVMDEADLESHGCGITGDQGFLNKTPSWKNAFLDRVTRMVERDKNETCIVMWSVGNEIGAGENAEACAEYLRNLTDKKPVQYHALKIEDATFSPCGYCNIQKMERVKRESVPYNKPVLLLEYAHAMGNSPGNLETLWDYVLDNPEFTGGYVWEFRSHGKRRIKNDGTVDYLYGGDFHDDNHWSNFTLDGYCVSDGTPKPTFEDLKYVYAPIRFFMKDGNLEIRNTQDFADSSAYKFEYELFCDGKTERHAMSVENIPPRGKLVTDFAPEYSGSVCYVTFRAYFNGETVSLKQFALDAKKPKEKFNAAKAGKILHDGDKVTVSGENFTVRFEKGVPVYYEKNGTVYFDTPMQFVTYRAETDNDGIVGLYPRWIGKWEATRLNKMRFFALSTVASDGTVRVSGKLAADHCYTGFDIDAVYTVHSDGTLLTDIVVSPFGNMPDISVYGSIGTDEQLTARLPRFGVCFRLNKERDTVKWLGRGENQSYTDSTIAAPIGTYEKNIKEMNFMFDVPQETGNREETYYVQLKNKENSFVAYGSEKLAFSYHPWKLDDLRNARHISELKEDEKYNYLYLDYRMRALGSFSCGPNPEKEFDFEPHKFEFAFAVNGEADAVPQHALKEFDASTKALSGLYTRPNIETEREDIECRSVE